MRVNRLVWDEFNTAHIALHGVLSEEVEQVCHEDPLIERLVNGRLFLTGPTGVGRMLVVILSSRVDGAFYPVTARSADRREQRIYYEKKEGVKNG